LNHINYITNNFNKFTIFIDDFLVPYDTKFSNDKLGPVGYCIITTENIETYGFLKEINILI